MTTGKKGSPTRVDATFVAAFRAWLAAQVIPSGWAEEWLKGRAPGDTGWTVRDFSRVIGIHETTVGRVLKDMRASSATIGAISSYTGIPGPNPTDADGVWLSLGRRLRKYPRQYAEVLAEVAAIVERAEDLGAQSKRLSDLARTTPDRKR